MNLREQLVKMKNNLEEAQEMELADLLGQLQIIQAKDGASRHEKAMLAQEAWRAQRHSTKYRDARDQTALLASCFPILVGRPFTNPFDPLQLDAFASEQKQKGEECHAYFHAVRFVLWIFDPYRGWQLGPFDLKRAWGRWDSHQQYAWKVWAEDPWWA